MDLISSLTSNVVHKSLDGLAQRQKAISSNLANVETPNYRRRDVQFEDALGSAIKKARGKSSSQANNDVDLSMKSSANANHFRIGSDYSTLQNLNPMTSESEGVKFTNDGNAVDMEAEMVQMAKNTMKYQALSNLESRRMRSIKSVIQSQ